MIKDERKEKRREDEEVKGSRGKVASQVALVGKDPPANTGVRGIVGLVPGLGRSPGGEHGNPRQSSRLENPRDRGVWWVAVHEVAKCWTQLEQFSMHGHRGTAGKTLQGASLCSRSHTLVPIRTLCGPGTRTPGGRARL